MTTYIRQTWNCFKRKFQPPIPKTTKKSQSETTLRLLCRSQNPHKEQTSMLSRYNLIPISASRKNRSKMKIECKISCSPTGKQMPTRGGNSLISRNRPRFLSVSSSTQQIIRLLDKILLLPLSLKRTRQLSFLMISESPQIWILRIPALLSSTRKKISKLTNILTHSISWATIPKDLQALTHLPMTLLSEIASTSRTGL
ncbi:hypothetical protein FGO68_gene14264 [Halteria grandinella]|uniref:Uncharacterized protein n=1 Tax=Halteria grandinella TaxID=5974 RepID=A0A8J8NN44_HALGN|nr:hypothetical protein FGO68_gene14264 [Halteria grandinella]